MRYRKPIFGALFFACFCMRALAQTSAPQYTVNEEPPTGSAIRRTITSPAQVPINKRYDELTLEEKQSLNQNYESMGPGDEPPFPAYGLKPIYTAVGRVQQKLLVKGDLLLFATVDQEGNVTQIRAVGDPDPEMTRVVASILTLTKFKPALCKGVPCKMDYPFRFRFNVE
ncbi:MAG TPA: hypothetical protein VMZ74_03335 [Ramlibacter sp.]|nr:hypothetical protein [Ramlibacter sp.]